MNNFPPLFPKSKYLSKKPWHQIIFILSFIYSATSLYSHFFTFWLVLINLNLVMATNWDRILGLPLFIPLLPLTFFMPHTKVYSASSLNTFFYHDPNWGLIILMGYFLLSVFLPSIIYKILLQGFLGNIWKK